MADQDRWNESRRYGRPAPRTGYEQADDYYGEYSAGGSPGEGRREDHRGREPHHDNRYAPFGASGPVAGPRGTYDENRSSGWGGQRESRDYGRGGRPSYGAAPDPDPSHYADYGRPAEYPGTYRGGRRDGQSGGYLGDNRDDRGDRFEARARRAGEEARSWWDKATDKVSSLLGDDDDNGRYSAAAQGYGGEHRGRGPKGYRRSDERIREDVSDRLTEDPYLDASDIEVSVENSEVTLSGTIRRREDKRRAENLAEAISGVTHVQNNLRVGGAGQGGNDLAGVGI